MADPIRQQPPFRAEHVGSFLRPSALSNAARRFRSGDLDAAAFKALQDDCIRDVIRYQESLGLHSATDGEFRRRSWSAGFIDAVEGFGLREGSLTFKSESGKLGVASSPYAKTPVRRTRGITTDEFRFLRSAVTSATPKVTMPSPPVMHYFLGPRSIDEAAYGSVDDYLADLIAVYRQEVADLAALGCTYLQLDDTAVPCNCDDNARAQVRARGEDPDRLTETYVQLINEAIADRPSGMTVAMHLCRGNLKGAWMAEGGYEPVAERLFGDAAVDAFFLEYDTPRAGDFAPLRFMPEGKFVVLGLVSTKTPDLENADDLQRRIEEASRYVPLERLCLSPQCGFASAPGSGQVLTEDDQARKLERIVEVAEVVWGTA